MLAYNAEIRQFLRYGYSQTVYFDWCIIPQTTVCRHLRQFTATLYTSSMAVVTVVDNYVTITLCIQILRVFCVYLPTRLELIDQSG